MNGRRLAGKNVTVTINRPMCWSCEKVLPKVGLELGNPTVTFRDMDGKLIGMMRDGEWVELKKQ